MLTKTRAPTTPGEILRAEFLEPMGLSQVTLAKHIDCDVKVINRIVNGASAVSVEMALKLGACFDTTPELWLNLQREVDIYKARQAETRLPESLHPDRYARA